MRDSGFVTFILILALLYIICPIDLVPDVIPVVGWADDVAVGVGAGAAAFGRRQKVGGKHEAIRDSDHRPDHRTGSRGGL